eukprot:12703-Heterococcus_DN1.PRE.1
MPFQRGLVLHQIIIAFINIMQHKKKIIDGVHSYNQRLYAEGTLLRLNRCTKSCWNDTAAAPAAHSNQLLQRYHVGREQYGTVLNSTSLLPHVSLCGSGDGGVYCRALCEPAAAQYSSSQSTTDPLQVCVVMFAAVLGQLTTVHSCSRSVVNQQRG